jgi:hypothetical protein
VASSWGPLLAFFIILTSSWAKHLPLTHHPYLVANPKWDWVTPSAFAWVFASSGIWRSFELYDSCYSWWLPPPRRLETAEELWQELVIVRGHLLMIVRGSYAFPSGGPKATLVDCSCHWSTSLVGGSCGVHGLDEVHATPLSCQTTKCWSTQQGRSVPASTWTSGEKYLCLLPFGILLVYWLVIILVIGSSPTRRYNNLEFSITISQTSCRKPFSVASFESLLCSLSSSSGAL